MGFFGGEPVTTTPPPALLDFPPNTYIFLMSILFGGSVLANSNGFFGPW